MKISVVSENTSTISSDFIARFGLGIVIQINNKLVLIDCGPDNSFTHNMNKLNISIQDIDYCIITHGHYDHGGGLEEFLLKNAKAQVFMSSQANKQFYSNNLQTQDYKYIGLNQELLIKYAQRINFISTDIKIDNQITLNTINRNSNNFFPKMNSNLYVYDQGKYINDDFSHELAVLLNENDKNVIVTGCAHSGVTNMIDTVLEKNSLHQIHTIVGGFHLVNPGTKKLGEPEDNIISLTTQLNNYNISNILTGHCTGIDGFELLKKYYHGNTTSLTTGLEIDF
jgi:Metal-dependent hydrolases of the beta-lactamase superfamily II